MHHSERGSPYVSTCYTERLAEAGIEPPVGSRGDRYAHALAETINAGGTRPGWSTDARPVQTREAVARATRERVSWFNHHRLLEPLGYIPSAEAEANHHRQIARQAMPA